MLYCEQLQTAIMKYHNMQICKDENDISYLKGVLDVPNDNQEVVNSFLIEIKFSKGFPYRFPLLREIGGVIPNEADWHKYGEDQCCITVTADEVIKCRNGITVSTFIEGYAIPYFANYIYKRQTNMYKNGEYGHGKLGVFQFYATLLKTEDMLLWSECFRQAFQNTGVSIGRNDGCFCGSGQKYKQCHLRVYNSLRLIGQEQVLQDMKKLTG